MTGTAPPVTVQALATRGYDQVTLRRALTAGRDVTGRQMSAYVPRWRLSDAELHALLRYLGTL